MIPSGFDYCAPKSLREALELLSSYKEEGKLIAGGQSLVPLMKLRLARPKVLIDIGRVSGLNSITDGGDSILIGALATHAQLERSDFLKSRCPLLPQTAATVGDVQVRNQGTLGGSLAHADPAGDLPATILALGAHIKAVSRKAERWIKAEDFFLGLMTTAIEPDEILTEIRVPLWNKTKSAYLKAAQRAAAFAVAGVAVRLELDQDGICKDIAIGVTGVTDKAYCAHNIEEKLRGTKLEPKLVEEAASQVTDGIDVNEDVNGSKEYRAHLARVYTARAIVAAKASTQH
ncbi:MAG TPA: xanthine dehydrogenase family protein subunit M [Candidatus Binatia bacterium]|jgi:carbon-monoxide dehydrogenase medium subunit|nr:xanthine dehydrogenase family protein subunit M [Candidatus Binatia bacterium]